MVKALIDFRLPQRENSLTAGVQSFHLGVWVLSEVSLKGKKTKNPAAKFCLVGLLVLYMFLLSDSDLKPSYSKKEG